MGHFKVIAYYYTYTKEGGLLPLPPGRGGGGPTTQLWAFLVDRCWERGEEKTEAATRSRDPVIPVRFSPFHHHHHQNARALPQKNLTPESVSPPESDIAFPYPEKNISPNKKVLEILISGNKCVQKITKGMRDGSANKLNVLKFFLERRTIIWAEFGVGISGSMSCQGILEIRHARGLIKFFSFSTYKHRPHIFLLPSLFLPHFLAP